MSTIVTKFRKAVLAMLAVVTLSLAASAQESGQVATILATNTDLKNALIFVEIAFDGQSCMEYNLKFRLETKTHGDLGYRKIKVVSGPVMREEGISAVTWTVHPTTGALFENTAAGSDYIAQLKNGDTVMYGMKASGYTLVFDLPTGTTTQDTAKICLESTVFSQVCEKCGVGGTDMIFTPNDIHPDCPYPNKAGDLVACYKRDSKAGNWEGWIFDRRDCQSYRIVQMPDERWWLAQNLNFGDYATSSKRPQNRADAAGIVGGAIGTDVLNTFWCPGGQDLNSTGDVASSNTSPTTKAASSNPESCERYGALYSWQTAMSLDGYAVNVTDANLLQAMPYNVAPELQVSTRRGVCPQGWFVPSDYDWGAMLNSVEQQCGCAQTTPTGANPNNTSAAASSYQASPCYHNFAGILLNNTNNNAWAASRCAFKDLLSTDVAPARGINAEPSLGGSMTNGNGASNVYPALNFSTTVGLQSPATIRTYANDNNDRWNYFLPETAGTDKYGFSIKPAGVRDGSNANSGWYYYYRGEFAGFWTSTHNSTNITPAYATSNDAFMRGFRYNYRMNADYNSAVQRWVYNKRFGLSVRCIAKRDIDT